MTNRAAIARNVVGIIGNVISFGLFLSPTPTFYRIIKKKTVEEFKPDPYIATILNCAFWVFYGLPFVHPHSILVLTINSVGLVLEFVYVVIFYVYAKKMGRVMVWLLVEAVCFTAIVLITMLALHGTKRRSLVVGILSDVFNVMMYASPLTIMAKVIRSKSLKYMPFWLSVTNFLNGLCWTTYALLHPFDIYVLISNGLGAISGAVQLILYACYCYGEEEKEKDVSTPNHIQISTIVNAS